MNSDFSSLAVDRSMKQRPGPWACQPEHTNSKIRNLSAQIETLREASRASTCTKERDEIEGRRESLRKELRAARRAIAPQPVVSPNVFRRLLAAIFGVK